jgi:hypothetical protein
LACGTTTAVTGTVSDPGLNGWSYCNPRSADFDGDVSHDCSEEYPYYYPATAADSSPTTYCVTYDLAGNCIKHLEQSTGGHDTLNFFDFPKDPCLFGGTGAPCGGMTTTSVDGVLNFRTQLVGMIDSTHFDPLFSFDWFTDYNAIDGGTATTASDVFFPNPLGTGGITLSAINGVPLDTPSGVPEPITVSLFAAGVAGAFAARRNKKMQKLSS